MGFRELCRIPGRTGLFDVTVENSQLVQLTPVGETNNSSCLWLTAGLFDIQVNGMLGHSLSGDDLTIDKVLAVHAELEKHGITRWCPTVTTQDPRIVERNLSIINQVMESSNAPGIHCIHLEGHYISSEEGYRGVHQEGYIRDPDPEEFDRWQRAAGGRDRARPPRALRDRRDQDQRGRFPGRRQMARIPAALRPVLLRRAGGLPGRAAGIREPAPLACGDHRAAGLQSSGRPLMLR